MPLRLPRHLPHRFSRRLSPSMQSFVKRRHERKARHRREQMHWWKRRGQRWFQQAATLTRRWLLAVVASLGLLVLGLILFSPIVRVREVAISRAEPRIDIEAVQLSLKEFFGRHMLFLPARDVVRRVREAVPDAADVTVFKDYPSRLAVSISLRPLVARLVIEDPAQGAGAAHSGAMLAASGSEVSSSLHHFLTDNGLYVALQTSASGLTLPTIHIVDWAARPVPSTPMLTPAFLDALRAAERALIQQFGQTITRRTVYLRAREFHLSTAKFTVWFDTDSPLTDQLARYRAFLESVPPGEVKQYIDLRAAGKVVYR